MVFFTHSLYLDVRWFCYDRCVMVQSYWDINFVIYLFIHYRYTVGGSRRVSSVDAFHYLFKEFGCQTTLMGPVHMANKE